MQFTQIKYQFSHRLTTNTYLETVTRLINENLCLLSFVLHIVYLWM